MRPTSIISLRAAAALSATDNGAAVDVSKFTGNGYVVLNSSATGAADNTSNVKIQHSDDGATGWADTGVAFAQVTNVAASFQSLFVSLDQFKKYVRVVNTLAGTTPTVTAAVSMVGTQITQG
jgi:O-glycosyl hydrolase